MFRNHKNSLAQPISENTAGYNSFSAYTKFLEKLALTTFRQTNNFSFLLNDSNVKKAAQTLDDAKMFEIFEAEIKTIMKSF